MNVLVINGSPEIHGCTDRALLEVERILNQNGIDNHRVNIDKGRLDILGDGLRVIS